MYKCVEERLKVISSLDIYKNIEVLHDMYIDIMSNEYDLHDLVGKLDINVDHVELFLMLDDDVERLKREWDFEDCPDFYEALFKVMVFSYPIYSMLSGVNLENFHWDTHGWVRPQGC